MRVLPTACGSGRRLLLGGTQIIWASSRRFGQDRIFRSDRFSAITVKTTFPCVFYQLPADPDGDCFWAGLRLFGQVPDVLGRIVFSDLTAFRQLLLKQRSHACSTNCLRIRTETAFGRDSDYLGKFPTFWAGSYFQAKKLIWRVGASDLEAAPCSDSSSTRGSSNSSSRPPADLPSLGE